MLVRFLEHEVNAIVDWDRIYSIPKYEVLSAEKVYIVFGISINNKVVKYDILFNLETYTITFPSHLFEVLDNRLSRFFCFGKTLTGDNDEITFISFREWVADPFFYYKLVEGESREVILFEYYKKFMELEFRNPQVETKALLKEKTILECPKCGDIWEEQALGFEMCKCNKCGTILLNPLSNISLVSEG